MLRPTSETLAQGPMTRTADSLARSACNLPSNSPSRVFAAGSSDTVTLVSDVDTRSTDMPCSLNVANTSARKPTWCHMPGLSSEISVMPLRFATAFTCAEPSPTSPVISVPSRSGVCVA